MKQNVIKKKTMKGGLSIVLIAVIATIFAACSNDIVLRDTAELQTDNPKAIGFTSYSEKITRGDTDVNTNLEYYHNTFEVYGTKQSTVDSTVQYVFGKPPAAFENPTVGVVCTYQASPDSVLGDWKYNHPRFWDKQASYDFVAFAPENAPLKYKYNVVDGTGQVGDANNEFVTTTTNYTLTGTNLQATASTAEKVKGFTGGADLDIMISAPNAQNGSAHDDQVNLVFSHILSKLNVTFAKAAALDAVDSVTITGVEITGLKEKGSYSQKNYNLVETTSGWTTIDVTVTPSTYKLAYSGSQNLNASTDSALYFIESLVMPQTIADDQVALVVKYTITSGTYFEDYTYKLDLYDIAALRKFFDGYNYTLNFTIAPDVIKFDATVTPWTDQAAVNQTIQ